MRKLQAKRKVFLQQKNPARGFFVVKKFILFIE